MYLLTYKSIDGNNENELEFDDLVAAQDFVDKREGLLDWWDLHDAAGNRIDGSC